MKTSIAGRPRISGVLIVVVIISAVIYFVSSGRPAEPEATVPATVADTGGLVPFRMEQQWLIRLKLAKAQEATLARQIRSVGRVVPAAGKRAIVAPPVDGIISSRSLPRIGDRVSSGQLIATLIQTPTAAEAAQMRTEALRLEAERRRLGQAEVEAQARLNAARSEAERARRLYDRKAYSQRQLEGAEADYKAAEANVRAVQEQSQALGASVPAATYEVRSPIAGTVITVTKAIGEQVHAGEAILEVVAMDTVWVEAPIFEPDLGRLGNHTEATFTTAAFPDAEFHGRLVTAGSVVDEKTRAANAVFEVPNNGHQLRIGMQANVRLDAGERVTVVLVPKESVLDNEGRKIVYVLRSGEEFQRRDVTLGDEYGDKIAILSGVQKGERVVTQGAYQLKLQELRPADAGAHTHEI